MNNDAQDTGWVVGLSNDEILDNLLTIVANGSVLLARLLVCLGAVEERRLHLDAGYSSMYKFCLRKLHMSEGEANRRIAAARLARQYPLVIETVARGAIHLCALSLLRPHLTMENHEELITAASYKTKEQVIELLAHRFPQPDAPSLIRKLPIPHLDVAPSQVPQTNLLSLVAASSVATAIPPTPHEPATMPCQPPQQTPRNEQRRAEQRPTQQKVAPLSPDRFKVQFTADAKLRGKIEHALRLMSHRNPSHDIAKAFEYALDLAIAQLESERLGKTKSSRTRAQPTKHGQKKRGQKTGQGKEGLARRAIPRAVRREVYERDGQRCAFVSKGGMRCEERSFLEIDHVHAHALGGSNDATNLRLHCKGHNQHRADEVFGRDYMNRARIRTASQTMSKAPSLEAVVPAALKAIATTSHQRD